MSKRVASIVLLLGLLLGSCTLMKPGVRGLSDRSEMHPLEVNQRQFEASEGLRGRVKAELISPTDRKSVVLSVRIKPGGGGLLLSAPLGVAKALVLPEELSFYNRLDKTYYKGSLELLDKVLPARLTYEHLERLFLGQLLFEEAKLNLSENQRMYIDLSTNKASAVRLFSGRVSTPITGEYRVELAKDRPQILKQFFETENNERFELVYAYNSKASYTPDRIVLSSGERRLVLEMEGIQLDTKLSLPFQIPTGYTLVK